MSEYAQWPDNDIKVALIAGGGQIPVDIANYLKAIDRPYGIIRLDGLCDQSLYNHPGITVGLGDFAAIFSYLLEHEFRHICMVGYVKRPDFNTMRRDRGGAEHLPSIAQAGMGGDDSLLRQVVNVFESKGLTILGAHELYSDLCLTNGPMVGAALSEADQDDLATAIKVTQTLGALDIGQACVVVRRVVLAVEAQEGTQAMLDRLLSLSPNLLGTESEPSGILVKCAKPIQDLRIDMPTIGESTIDACHKANLKGIVGQTGAVLIADRHATLKRAQELGIFIHGVDVKYHD